MSQEKNMDTSSTFIILMLATHATTKNLLLYGLNVKDNRSDHAIK